MNAEQLNATRLAQIKERAEKATPGPWENAWNFCCIATFDEDLICGEVERDSDAEFIAHAREDIPQLVAEVERLQQRLSACESLLSEAHDVLDDVHCYETEVYVAITKYLYEEESE